MDPTVIEWQHAWDNQIGSLRFSVQYRRRILRRAVPHLILTETKHWDLAEEGLGHPQQATEQPSPQCQLVNHGGVSLEDSVAAFILNKQV